MPSISEIRAKLNGSSSSNPKQREYPFPRIKTISAEPGEDEIFAIICEKNATPIRLTSDEYLEFKEYGFIEKYFIHFAKSNPSLLEQDGVRSKSKIKSNIKESEVHSTAPKVRTTSGINNLRVKSPDYTQGSSESINPRTEIFINNQSADISQSILYDSPEVNLTSGESTLRSESPDGNLLTQTPSTTSTEYFDKSPRAKSISENSATWSKRPDHLPPPPQDTSQESFYRNTEPEVGTTSGHSYLRSNLPEHNPADQQPEIKATGGVSDLRSNLPGNEFAISSAGPINSYVKKEGSEVDMTSGDTNLRSNQPDNLKEGYLNSTKLKLNKKSSLNKKKENHQTTDCFNIVKYYPNNFHDELNENHEGTFQIPHIINQFVIRVCNTKNELMVFYCLIRFSLGFHKFCCQTSNSFIAEWCGLDPANVRKTLKILLSRGLIKIHLKSTATTTAEYNIPVIEGHLEHKKNSSKNNGSIAEKISGQKQPTDTSGQNNQRSTQPPGSGHFNLEPQVEITCNKENYKEINKNKTLSIQTENFLQTVYSEKIRKKEREILFELIKSGKLETEIVNLAEFLILNGTLKKEKCDRPISYLASGVYEKILNLSLGKRNTRNNVEINPERIFDAISKYSTSERLPEAFERTLTDEEMEWINKMGGRRSLGQWTPQRLLKELGIESYKRF